jgi:hypothetical protein
MSVIVIADLRPSSFRLYKSRLPICVRFALRYTTMSLPFARLVRASTPCLRSLRSFSTTRAHLASTIIPTTQTCPSPTCVCASTPPDLEIDHKVSLLNTMAAYSEHVILCTGQEDWHSNIEQDEGATGKFVKGLKGVIGKGGQGFDVCESLSFTYVLSERSGTQC